MRLWIVRIMREKLLFLRMNYTFKLILDVIGNMHFWLLELTFLNCLYPYWNYALFDIGIVFLKMVYIVLDLCFRIAVALVIPCPLRWGDVWMGPFLGTSAGLSVGCRWWGGWGEGATPSSQSLPRQIRGIRARLTDPPNGFWFFKPKHRETKRLAKNKTLDCPHWTSQSVDFGLDVSRSRLLFRNPHHCIV